MTPTPPFGSFPKIHQIWSRNTSLRSSCQEVYRYAENSTKNTKDPKCVPTYPLLRNELVLKTINQFIHSISGNSMCNCQWGGFFTPKVFTHSDCETCKLCINAVEFANADKQRTDSLEKAQSQNVVRHRQAVSLSLRKYLIQYSIFSSKREI